MTEAIELPPACPITAFLGDFPIDRRSPERSSGRASKYYWSTCQSRPRCSHRCGGGPCAVVQTLATAHL